MAVERKRMQQRSGTYSEFTANSLLAGEFGVVTSGCPETSDGKAVYIQVGSSAPKRVLTADSYDVSTAIYSLFANYLLSAQKSLNSGATTTTIRSTVDGTGSTTHAGAASYINIPSTVGFKPGRDGTLIFYKGYYLILDTYYSYTADGSGGYNIVFTEPAYQTFDEGEEIVVTVFVMPNVISETVAKVWSGTQAQYEQITHDADTLYIITGAST